MYKDVPFHERPYKERLDYFIEKVIHRLLSHKKRARLVVNNLRRRDLLKRPQGDVVRRLGGSKLG